MSAEALRAGARLGPEIRRLREAHLAEDPTRRVPRLPSLVATHLYLCTCAAPGSNEVRESVPQIAEALAENPRTVRRALEFFAEVGLWRIVQRGNQHVRATVRAPSFIDAEDLQRSGAPEGAEDLQRSHAAAPAEDRQRSGAPDVQGTVRHVQRTVSGPPPETRPEEKRGEGARELALAVVERGHDELPAKIAGLEAIHGADVIASALRSLHATGARFTWPSGLIAALDQRIAAQPVERRHATGPGAQPPKPRPASSGEPLDPQQALQRVRALRTRRGGDGHP